ncbi:hypothetical protein NPIL_595241 [Nephila pilipes]|uniref:Uncharacterized protein n=1 Tax=Nephila pilipes TaxID=299642 RepID=A0A8X6N0B9_NEPPI|nr:hypothetical protein NPIL_595241 [Nephila pilipes]
MSASVVGDSRVCLKMERKGRGCPPPGTPPEKSFDIHRVDSVIRKSPDEIAQSAKAGSAADCGEMTAFLSTCAHLFPIRFSTPFSSFSGKGWKSKMTGTRAGGAPAEGRAGRSSGKRPLMQFGHHNGVGARSNFVSHPFSCADLFSLSHLFSSFYRTSK